MNRHHNNNNSMTFSEASSTAATTTTTTTTTASNPHSTTSTNVPSLNQSLQTMSTTSIPTTNQSSSASETQSRESSSLKTNLQCAFAFLDCKQEFSDADDWKTHCTSHFRTHCPPSSLQCPFCESKWTTDDDDDNDAWNARLDHVATRHCKEKLSFGVGYRVDYDLFRYLWNIKVINHVQFQELLRDHWSKEGGNGGIYIETNNPRRDRREGAPRGWTSYRV